MIDIAYEGVHLTLESPEDGPVRLLHLGARPFDPRAVPEEHRWAYRLAEIRIAGDDQDYIAAGRLAGTGVGGRLRYFSHSDEQTRSGRVVSVVQRDAVSGLEVAVEITLKDSVAVFRTSIEHTGSAKVTLLDVSSAFVNGLAKGGTGLRGDRVEIHIPRSGWYAEFQWTRHRASELGLNNRFAFGSRHETIRSIGSWCSSNYLPMGFVQNRMTSEALLFELMHGGSWSWQVGETADDLYLYVAGPGEQEGWWRTLAPGERFDAVPVAFAPASSFDLAMAAMTRHRRATRLVANDGSPVVFNDYMNCLMGDPTEDKVMPLIDIAADLGAEVYCMDSGWYAPPGERWSNKLGQWEVNRERFPNGLEPIVARIRERGMIPGIWFEIEGMTANCPGFAELPDDWFFIRHGERVVSHRRYQLDFRNPHVRAFATGAIEQAVANLGFRFLKLDYNFSSGVGSDVGSPSPGQALVEYEVAFLTWLDGFRARFPDLMIEHCASGGQRLGRPYLDRTHNASNSDEGDPLQIARIAAAAPTILLPEQNGTWAVPQPDYDDEMTAFSLICGLPFRMLLAGGARNLSARQQQLVREAVVLHKQLRPVLQNAVPSWPLGLPQYDDPWVCVALEASGTAYLAIWHRVGGEARCDLPLPDVLEVQLIFPEAYPTNWSLSDGRLQVELPERSARLFQLVSSKADRR